MKHNSILGITLGFILLSPAGFSADKLVVGTHAGVNISRITKSVFDTDVGYSFGADTKYYFIPNLGVGSGLDLEARPLGTKSGAQWVDGTKVSNDTGYFLDIPLLLTARAGQKNQVFVDLGPLVAIPLSDHLAKSSSGEFDIKTNLKWGSEFRVGYLYQTQNKWGIGGDFTSKFLPEGAFASHDRLTGQTDTKDFYFISAGFNFRITYGFL